MPSKSYEGHLWPKLPPNYGGQLLQGSQDVGCNENKSYVTFQVSELPVHQRQRVLEVGGTRDALLGRFIAGDRPGHPLPVRHRLPRLYILLTGKGGEGVGDCPRRLSNLHIFLQGEGVKAVDEWWVGVSSDGFE